MTHHRAGHLAAAEAEYQRVLAVEPAHPDGPHLLGVIAHQVGENGRAIELIQVAIARRPDVPEFHNNLVNALLAVGRLDEALATARRAVDLLAKYSTPAVVNWDLSWTSRDTAQPSSCGTDRRPL